MEFYISPTEFGRSPFTVRDITSISYATINGGTQANVTSPLRSMRKNRTLSKTAGTVTG